MNFWYFSALTSESSREKGKFSVVENMESHLYETIYEAYFQKKSSAMTLEQVPDLAICRGN